MVVRCGRELAGACSAMRSLGKDRAALTGSVSSQLATENNCKVKQRYHHPSETLNQLEVPEHIHSPSLEMLLRRLRAMEAQQDDKFASILDVVGKFGTFQRRLVALTFIPNILLAFFMFADIFMFTAQKPYCNTSWILAIDPNLSEAEQLNLTLPREPNGSFQTCLMYLPVAWDLDSIIQFGLNYTVSCQDGWIYPETKKRSLVNEFDLVCGKESNMEGAQTMFLAGLLIGSLIFGFVSDKLGRYPTILMSLLGLIIFGFGAAFVNTFHQYLFFRFVVSQALVCYAISSVCLATEWLVGQHRAHAIILEHCFFSMGVMFLTGLAYILPHWRLLFLVGGAPVFPLISYIWMLPESPRWLMLKGKLGAAKRVLCYAASVNEKTIPLSLLDKLQLPGKKVTKASVLDFYNNRHLRKVTLVMGCVWFTVGYSYFTMSLKLKDFGVNINLTQVVPGLMEVPARLCCIFLLELMGRKWSLILTLFQGSLMCLLILILPPALLPSRAGVRHWSTALPKAESQDWALEALRNLEEEGVLSRRINPWVAFFQPTSDLIVECERMPTDSLSKVWEKLRIEPPISTARSGVSSQSQEKLGPEWGRGRGQQRLIREQLQASSSESGSRGSCSGLHQV
ncbi:solute carrier family 22 member 14 isoform 3-T3 [Lycaon pictus]